MSPRGDVDCYSELLSGLDAKPPGSDQFSVRQGLRAPLLVFEFIADIISQPYPVGDEVCIFGSLPGTKVWRIGALDL